MGVFVFLLYISKFVATSACRHLTSVLQAVDASIAMTAAALFDGCSAWPQVGLACWSCGHYCTANKLQHGLELLL
jgi:hypothetical protein